MRGRHVTDDIRDQSLTRCNKLLDSYRLLGHAHEATVELNLNILALGEQDLVHRPGVAEQIDYEGTAQSIVDTLVSQQFARVKEVAWVLAVKRSYDPERLFRFPQAI